MNAGLAAFLSELDTADAFRSTLRKRLRKPPGRIGLPAAEDPRVAVAALALDRLGLARPVLIGDAEPIAELLRTLDSRAAPLPIVDPGTDGRRSRVAARLLERRAAKGMRAEEAASLAAEPLHFAAGLLALGEVDAVVAGASAPTAEVIRAALYAVGTREGIGSISGAFLLLPPAGAALARPLLFADAAVIPEPTDEQLRSIGLAAAQSFRFLCQREPRIACLSFSTHGSAEHASAARMRRLAERLSQDGLSAEGELQVDAALVPEIAARKAAGGQVAGQADVLIFPDLNAANIGYKIAERLGAWSALGPLLQGFARPMHDLSRGCTARDVFDVCTIALLEASACES